MRILLVDDEPSLLQLLSQYLQKAGHEPVCADCCAAAIEASGTVVPDAAVVDLSLPDGSGEDVAKSLLASHPGVHVVIATGYSYEAPEPLQGSISVLQKPFLPRALLNVLASGRPDLH